MAPLSLPTAFIPRAVESLPRAPVQQLKRRVTVAVSYISGLDMGDIDGVDKEAMRQERDSRRLP
jgi:hypothetical protein